MSDEKKRESLERAIRELAPLEAAEIFARAEQIAAERERKSKNGGQ